MSKLVITDLFSPRAVAESAVLSLKRLSLDDAEQLVSSALYGLPDERREVVRVVYDGVKCDALNSCRSFGVEFLPSARLVPSLYGGDQVLHVSLDPPARFGDFDGFGGIAPSYLAGHDPALARRLDRLIAEARASLAFVLLEVECEVAPREVAPVGDAEVLDESLAAH